MLNRASTHTIIRSYCLYQMKVDCVPSPLTSHSIVSELQTAGCPIAYFKCDPESRRVVVHLSFPFPVGRYVLLKMIKPSWPSPNASSAPNIDIEYFAVFGSDINI
jgi:hypothetical protein